MYVIVDIEKVVNPPSGIGLIEIYYQATGSKTITIILLAAFAFCLFGCAVANITGSSRQIWAASRDNCYPLSTWWARIHPQFQMPVNAAVLSGAFTTVWSVLHHRAMATWLTILALRAHLCRINNGVHVYGQRQYCFYDDFVCHSSGYSGLEGPFYSASRAAL